VSCSANYNGEKGPRDYDVRAHHQPADVGDVGVDIAGHRHQSPLPLTEPPPALPTTWIGDKDPWHSEAAVENVST
jgi:hypothetical protein